ncbi:MULTISPECIES: hypothetical protein [unclassified Microbacterium]|uniref:hypothetical protein n=1 Tax=unclassified Microbacterium TaxID=2609290 RepID=UPI001D5C1DFC|nr:hypothetical protein [Microbacterium sp. Bi121]CAH0133626.1 hypothetical protein SRABI121_00834 [Microbacterium sp. Bi121]
MNVVVVTTRAPTSQPLGDLSDTVRVRWMMPTGGVHSSAEVLVIAQPHGPVARAADRISRMLSRNAAARMLLRMSPLDPGARFWRAVRGDARVREFLCGVDLLVAGDRDANFTCWQLARRADLRAVSGYAAAKQEVP